MRASGAKACGVRASGASRASKARVSGVSEARASKSGKDKGKQGEEEQQQFPFSLHHHPNFYDFFLSAIAPFTGNVTQAISTLQVIMRKRVTIRMKMQRQR